MKYVQIALLSSILVLATVFAGTAQAGVTGGASGGGGGGSKAIVISMGPHTPPILDCFGMLLPCDDECQSALEDPNSAETFLLNVCNQISI